MIISHSTSKVGGKRGGFLFRLNIIIINDNWAGKLLLGKEMLEQGAVGHNFL